MDNPHKTHLTIPKQQPRPVGPQPGGSKGPVNVFSFQDTKRPAPKLIIPDIQKSKWRKEEYDRMGNERVVRIASAPLSGDIAQATPVRAVISTTGDKSSHVIIKSSHASISDDEFSVKSPLVPSSRKPCNCSKSRCLKLYCDCFANGAVCYNCNCVGCHNNVEHSSERSSAVQSLLSRNPSAFTPKIDERSHQKGCNCKRSACLKNYCECYGAGIPCSLLCRCEGCRNTESKFVRRRDRPVEVVNYGRQERGSLQEFEEYILSTTERIQEYKARKQSDPRII